LPQARVVVDDEDEGPAAAAPGARPLEERLEIAPPVPAMAARCIEGGHAALVGPFADRRLRHAEESRSLAEGEPVRLAGWRSSPGIRHHSKSSQSCSYLNAISDSEPLPSPCRARPARAAVVEACERAFASRREPGCPRRPG